MRFWKQLSITVLTGMLVIPALADTTEMRLFRIGTGGSGGTYYPIGGLVALAISNPPGSRSCESGGSCGVPGLVAIAQSSNGSVANVRAVQSGVLESAFAQSDVAYWAFTGSGSFRNEGPAARLRTIASLYPESIHLVTRRESGIRTVRDLRGKRVSLDEPGSGTLTDARIVLEAFGLNTGDFEAEYIKPGVAAEKMLNDQIDAFFFVAGYPAPSISRLAAEKEIYLVPLEGAEVHELIDTHRFFSETVIPENSYEGVGPTPTLSVGAQLITSSELDEELVYEITKSLWNTNSRWLLDNGHAKGRSITLETALEGIATPLHPGAELFYREVGMLAREE